jgi:hypothetical protein
MISPLPILRPQTCTTGRGFNLKDYRTDFNKKMEAGEGQLFVRCGRRKWARVRDFASYLPC